MGCGSSSLKGDAPSGVDADAPQPIRKVNTNFSTINYDPNESKKRRMTEYAPDDTVRNYSEASGVDPNRPVPSNKPPGAPADDIGPDGEKLEPYHTLSDDPNDIPLKDRSYPHENAGSPSSGANHINGISADDNNGEGPDPTSTKAKDNFASTNDPINHQSGSVGLSPEDGAPADKKKRGSWIDRIKGGEPKEISDEDMKKYTGKTKAEMSEFMQKGEGVGARQGARNYAVSGDGGAVG